MVPAFQPRVPRRWGDANLAADNPALLQKRRHLKPSLWHIQAGGGAGILIRYAAQLMVPAFQPRVSRRGGDANLAAYNPALL